MAKNKNKAKAEEVKSNADSVLDDVLAPAAQEPEFTQEDAFEQSNVYSDAAEDTAQAETVAEVQEAVADAVESAGEPEAEQEPAVSNLTVSVKAKVDAVTTLEWKSQPCSAELENLLRHKAQHFAKLNYGINVSLTGVTQELLNKCASDYRFAREIEKLTRAQ